ncbi:MAG: hypothetical protein HOV73_25960 [Streptomyces sp.]|nr:hypothetical protein [Streptomyces sp.]NUR43532.1 hypothetical protein [Streptomyces sp.]NUS15226.1 hypothetical protein [Streptomyces sp.]NUS25566.1 hypothetical protein [Streptomyces sp.]NUS76548.1 hypothetical protein [Streptomyces sp.]
MLAAVLLAYFTLATLGALIGLAFVDFRTVPPVAGTCALIVTLAALGVAIVR